MEQEKSIRERRSKGLSRAKLVATPYGARAVVTAGAGSPTIIFESGMGCGAEDWSAVLSALSPQVRAIAYDRAGQGGSEKTKLPRDGHQMVMELRAVLEAIAAAPPYILVGHSLGGTLVTLFASMYPEEVVGVVLVDARPPDFSQRCRKLNVSEFFINPPAALFAFSAGNAFDELEASAQIMRQTRKAGKFPSVPLIVLTQKTAIKLIPESLSVAWFEGQRRLAKMSPLGKIKYCESGHKIHCEMPEVVVKAIHSVVTAAKYLTLPKSGSIRLGDPEPMSVRESLENAFEETRQLAL